MGAGVHFIHAFKKDVHYVYLNIFLNEHGRVLFFMIDLIFASL